MDTKAHSHVDFKFVNVHKNWTCMCTLDSKELLLECSIGMKEAQCEVEPCMVTYIYGLLQTISTTDMKDRLHGRLLTDGMDSG